MKTNIKTCIHDRTEDQKCALCNITSNCCNQPVLALKKGKKRYKCTYCDKICKGREDITRLLGLAHDCAHERLESVGIETEGLK
jgi:hypothetical protein